MEQLSMSNLIGAKAERCQILIGCGSAAVMEREKDLHYSQKHVFLICSYLTLFDTLNYIMLHCRVHHLITNESLSFYQMSLWTYSKCQYHVCYQIN